MLGLFHAQAANAVDDHDAEGQAGQRVHGVIALQKAGEEGVAFIGSLRFQRGDGGGGVHQRGDHQHGQKHQKDGGQDLAYMGENLAGLERERQYDGKKQEGEDRQRQRLVGAFRHQRRHRHGEGGGGATGDGEEGSDGQVQRAGKEVAVRAADLGAELHQAVAATDAHGGDAQKGQAYAGNDEANDRLPHIFSGQLSHVRGEDQISRAKEQAEEHGSDEHVFLFSQPFLHPDHILVRYVCNNITPFAVWRKDNFAKVRLRKLYLYCFFFLGENRTVSARLFCPAGGFSCAGAHFPV